MIQLLLATLMIGAVREVRQVHAGVGLSCPTWDCRCHQETLWKVEALDQGMVPGRVRPVGMIGRCTCRFGSPLTTVGNISVFLVAVSNKAK